MSSKTFDKKFIKELAQLLSDCDLTEIELEYDKARLRVCREVKQTVYTAPAATPNIQQQPAIVPNEKAQEAADQSTKEDAITGEKILSPMVGTAYLAPDPESQNFVKVGDIVNKGDTLLIVEAMKVMNNISASKSGTVKAMLVSDKQAVEFNQPLVIIE